MLVMLMSHPLMSSCWVVLWTLIYFYKNPSCWHTCRNEQQNINACIRNVYTCGEIWKPNISLGAAILPISLPIILALFLHIILPPSISTLHTCRPSCDRLHLIFGHGEWVQSVSQLSGVSCLITARFPSVFLSSVDERFLRSPQTVVANSHIGIQNYYSDTERMQYWWQRFEVKIIAASFHLIHKCDWRHINKCHTAQVPLCTYNIGLESITSP